MAKEIERKFIVSLDAGFRPDNSVIIEQAYISTGDPEVRVRRWRAEQGGWLTIKAGSGVTRDEVELVITDDSRLVPLWLMADPNRTITKIRERSGKWLIDTYLGNLFGLVIAEVELEYEGQSIPRRPVGVSRWIEVTEDERFKNKNLSGIDHDTLVALLSEVESSAGEM